MVGLVRDLNPGPLAPKARIIPLDQRAATVFKADFNYLYTSQNANATPKNPSGSLVLPLALCCNEKVCAPGWARTTNLSVNSRTR